MEALNARRGPVSGVWSWPAKLRDDVVDARRAFGGPVLPRIPYQERTWLRLRAEAVFRSDLGQRIRAVMTELPAKVRRTEQADLPPRRLQLLEGGGDFRATANHYRETFVELGGLRPDHDVLDVGSGTGRGAYALKDWLTGSYEGFDLAPEGIEWCTREITSRHPNFRFQLADIRSRRYNPHGRYDAETYRFPYDDASFDFAILTSVFTHLRKPALDNYLGELARVLRPRGRCLATYFLVNDETRRLMNGNGQFGFDYGDDLVVDPDVPERAVAFRDEAVRELHAGQGLPIETVEYGSWSGRAGGRALQDITVSVRR